MKICRLFLVIVLCMAFAISGFCFGVSYLLKMDYSFKGHPFIELPAKNGIVLTKMDYSFQGQPFVSKIVLHKWNGVIIKKWNGIEIKKWDGIE